MLRKKVLLYTLLMMLSAFLLGCADSSVPEETTLTVFYTVRYWVEDRIIWEEAVEENALPTAPSGENGEFTRFVGWDHPAEPIVGNTDFHAVLVPCMDLHVPYLFAREDGLLHPDAPFLEQDLADALRALVPEEAKKLLPELPEGTETVCAEQMRFWMDVFFPDAFYGIFRDLPEQTELTRTQAVQILNRYLRRETEKVSPAEDAFGFADVSSARTDYTSLMEAAVMHSDGTQPWQDILMPTGAEPGWQLCADGRARRYDENGYLFMDTVDEDGFRYTEDGWFTSESEELDDYTAEILSTMITKNPEADREQLLRKCYYYVRDSFQYLRKKTYDIGATGWALEDAEEMFRTGRGNCYNYASAFWALARNLGYPAETISGRIRRENGNFPHGWVLIYIDEKPYYCDPELEMVHRDEKSRYKMLALPNQYIHDEYLTW